MELNGWDEEKTIEVLAKFVHTQGLATSFTKFCGEIAEREEETGKSATSDDALTKCECPPGSMSIYDAKPACEWCKARNRLQTTDPIVGRSRALRYYLKTTIGKSSAYNDYSLASVKLILDTMHKDTLLSGGGTPESLMLEIDYLIEQHGPSAPAKNWL